VLLSVIDQLMQNRQNSLSVRRRGRPAARTAVGVTTLIVALLSLNVAAQRRSGGPATLAIFVTDESGKGISDVKVTAQGPATRDARTEAGRAVFEDVPSGTYKLRFERDGFVTLEREVNARTGAPIDVKVTLEAVPPPPPPPKVLPPVQPVAPPVDAAPVTVDIPAFIEKNYIGRAAGKTSPLGCAPGGSATLLQLNKPIAEHTHSDADEFLYVVAGDGAAHMGSNEQPLHPGVLVLVPRGVAHSLAASGRDPLFVLSIKAGDHCGPSKE
jgi:mannose-6-phosphate isomerase-like protein (cupin superfamily)